MAPRDELARRKLVDRCLAAVAARAPGLPAAIARAEAEAMADAIERGELHDG
jgi:hypothetical protein